MKLLSGGKLNGKKSELESEIDRIQNSSNAKEREKLDELKEDLQKLKDERELENARRYFAKNNLEGGRPTKFFCSINKKLKNKAQFEKLHVWEIDEDGEESIREVTKQSEVEWEVRKFYRKLYRKEASLIDKREILERIGDVKKICAYDKENLEKEITMEEVSKTLKNTINNVAPGA